MTYISKTRRATELNFCIRNAFMSIMIHTKFQFNRLMSTLIFGIWASEPPSPAWQTEMAGLDRAHLISSRGGGALSPPSMKNFNNY